MRLASTRDLSFHSSSDCSVDFVNNDQAKLLVDHITSVSPKDFRHTTKKNYSTNMNPNHENDITKDSHTTQNNYANNRRIKEYSSNTNNDQEEYNLEKELEEQEHKSNEYLYSSDTLHTSRINRSNKFNKSPKRDVKSSMHTITPSSSFVSAFSTEINREQVGKIGNANTLATSLSLTAAPRSNEQQTLTSRMLHDKMEQTINATQTQERIDRGNTNRFMPPNTNIESIEYNDEQQQEPLEMEQKKTAYSPLGWFGFVGNAASHGLSAIEEYLDHVLLDTKANTQNSNKKQRNSAANDNTVKNEYRKIYTENDNNNNNSSKENFLAKNKTQEERNDNDKSENAFANSEQSGNNNNGTARFSKHDESNISHEIHVPDIDHKAHVYLGKPPIRSSMQTNIFVKERVNEHRSNYNKYQRFHDDINSNNTNNNLYYEQHENNSVSSLSSGFGGIFNTADDSVTMDSRSNNLQTPISVSVNDGNVDGSIDIYAKSAHNALEHSKAKFSSENSRGNSHYHSSPLHTSHPIHLEPSTHYSDDHTINTEADHDDLHSPRVVQIHSQYMPCDGELPLGAQQIVLSSEQLARIERRYYSSDYDTNKVKNRVNDTQGSNNNNITSTLQYTRAKQTDNNNYAPFNNSSNFDDSQMELNTDSRDRGISRSDNDEDHEYDEYPAVEVDLISGLRGYREYPNEWYGHLVAAALNTRSLPNNPVTASELAEAGHNPFLVRLIVNSNALNTDDPLVRQNVQETVDALIDMHNDGADPALYEYLVNFLPITYIRLTHKQSAQLKSNGFEYIKLMYDNKHVLPSGNVNSIFFNYSFAVLLTNFIVAVIDLAAIVLCTIVIALSVAKWMDPRINENQQSYGFYTLLVFGCGYAARLIIILFIVKRKPNEFAYERANNLTLPSPYLYAVPVLPLFEIMCLVTFVEALHEKYVILAHNSLVASRLASVCFAVTFGFPQLITHSFLESNLNPNEHKERWRYVFTFLIVTVFVQWTLALLRFAWMTLMYESITGLGFARFNIRHSHRPFRYVSLFLHILHLISVFLIESDIYLIIACNIKFGRAEHDCTFLPVTITVLASIPIIFFLALYSWLVFSNRSSFLITLVDSFLFAAHIGIFTLSFDPVGERCTVFRNQIFHQYYTFGFGSLTVYWLVIACIVLTALMYFIVRLAKSKDHEQIHSTHFVTHSAAEPFSQYEKSARQEEEHGHLLPQCANETDRMTAVQYGRVDTQNNIEPSNFTFTAPDANNTVPARITRALTSTGNTNAVINNSKSSEESSEEESSEEESSSLSNVEMHPLPLLSSSLMSQSTTEQISSSTTSSSVSTVTRTAVKAAVNTKNKYMLDNL